MLDEPLAVVADAIRIINYNWRGQGMSSVFLNGSAGDITLGNTATEVDWPAATQAETYFAQSPDANPSTNPKRWLGTFVANGQGTTGMLYRRNRYFDPKSGQFTQADPTGIATGMNVFGFAGGDPINYSDPFGLCPPHDASFGPHCLGLAGLKAAISPLWMVPGRASRRTSRKIESSPPGQVVGALGDFVGNYQDMRDANTIGADKYFHAKANCEAAQRGPAGAWTATGVSNAREWTDQYLKGDPKSASDADQAANRAGRDAGASNPSGICSAMLGSFRPNGLPGGK